MDSICARLVDHPLKERFGGYDSRRILVSRNELDLIIEAVMEVRTDWECRLEEQEPETKEEEKEEEGLRNDLIMIDETLDFLEKPLVTP